MAARKKSGKKAAKKSTGDEQPRKAAPRQTNREATADASGETDQASPSGVKPLPQKASASPIVGIGASAGGLESLDELFSHMPSDTGMAFVVVTHQHPGRTSLLPELLARETQMPVVEAVDGAELQPNHVYVGPSGTHLAVLNGRLHRMETGDQGAPRLPIDYFFRSLAEDQKEHAVCMVLSGTGTDGTIGLRAIKGASGMAMVEQPLSARYAGMPSSAIATGLADFVLPPAQMPAQLIAYANGPYLKGGAVAASAPAIPGEPMQKIFVLLRNRTGHDFSAYKSNTVNRRIARRMNLHQITEPTTYVRYLQENPHEIEVLFKELLISVTSFFRDPEAWHALLEPLRHLIESKPENDSLRAWVPGCATGEEVYSLAITFREAMDAAGRRAEVQVFGTDLDIDAIEVARGGRYPDGIAVDVRPEWLEKYFTHDDKGYRIRQDIRETAIFAPQNFIKDPPFTRLDMISCRNLLIYLNSEVQKKLLPIFHYALRPEGLLLLGPSETIGTFTDCFQPVDKRWKLYRRRQCAVAHYVLPEMPAQHWSRGESSAGAGPAQEGDFTAPPPHRISTLAEKLLLRRFVPVSIVVNDRADILYLHGRTGAFLEPSEGQPRNNLLEMAREGLQLELASALRECVKHNQDVTRRNVRVKSNGEYSSFDILVTRIQEPEALRGLLCVTFRPAPPAEESGTSSPPADGADPRIEQLERDLRFLRESHQTTLEELEMSNEELRSANEELQSTNEELQSTNEELETSREEMQSLNEELTTVNNELQSKLDELSQSNNDMQNLLNSTDIATVFLDGALNISRYTEQARQLVRLRPSDIGRPIAELASNLEDDRLVEECRDVLKTLVYREREVRTRNGGWYLMRILPYRTTENVIDGLVITFVNIQQLKEAEKAGELRRYFESIVDAVRQPLLVLDGEHRVVTANRCFYETFRLVTDEVVGTPVFDIGNGEWNIPAFRRLLEDVLPRNQEFEQFKVDHEFPRIGHKVFMLNARRLEREPGLQGMILLAMEDVTESSGK